MKKNEIKVGGKKTKQPVSDPESAVKPLAVKVEQFTRHLMTAPANPADAAEAVGQRNWLKGMTKQIDATKKGITGPINEALKNVRELFRPVENRLESAIYKVTAGLDEFNREAQRQLEAKTERLEVQVENEEITEAKAERIIAKATARLGADVVPTREVRTIKVIDESLIPDEYWVLDTVKLRRDALAGTVIPGVEVVTEQQVYAPRS